LEAENCEIRNKLLSRLGIREQSDQKKFKTEFSSPLQINRNNESVGRDQQNTWDLVYYKRLEDDSDLRSSKGGHSPNTVFAFELWGRPLPKSSTAPVDLSGRTSTQDNRKKKKSVSFRDEVCVVPIPRRADYSSRFTKQLWCPVQELVENAHRNTIEFAAEGWNWRTVLEDDDMFICTVTGERIHPCHCQHRPLGSYQ